MRKITLPARITRASVQALINKLRSNPGYRIYTLWSGPGDTKARLAAWHRLQAATRQQMLIEMQGPLVTINEDGDVSSRDLTRFYVSAYCNMMHLKH